MSRSPVSLFWMKFLVVSLALSAAPARAASFSLADLTDSSNDSIKSLIETIAIGSDHRAYMSARPLGSTIGFDFGIDLTVINVPTEFINSMAAISNTATDGVPTTLFLPRLNFHKGLPFGIDFGVSYIQYQSMARTLGAELKWAFMRGGAAAPAVAVRASGNWDTLWFLKTSTYKLDVVASKNLILIDPYVGAGFQYWSGELQLPAEIPNIGLELSQSGMSPHFYAGVALKLLILKMTGEYDYSTSGVSTYGLKVSLAF
ncbi:MAG: hypothetical protein NDJ89_12160 [Oligoflexia bacterium]|nr:hypothetical protein [Oligoflexia bacterium]